MGTCKTGGMELLDIHYTVAPRRQKDQRPPVYQNYSFYPYDEHSLALSHLGPSVLEYAETCSSFALERMHHLLSSSVEDGLQNLKLMRSLVAKSSWTPVAEEKMKDCLSSPSTAALKTLEKIFTVANNDAFAENVNSIVSESWGDVVSSDHLFGFARSERCFKTCFDVVFDNIYEDNSGCPIKVVECDAGTGQAYPQAIRQLLLHPSVGITYIATDPTPAETIDEELAEKLGIDVVEWSLDSTKPVPGAESGADLVILANVLHRQDNISDALSAASSLVSNKGFLLVVEATSNFAIPWSFFALTHDVTNMSDIDSRTCGPFCDEQTWTKLLTDAGLITVARKSDGVLHTVFLCRKRSTSLEQVPRIVDVDDASFWWLEEVKAVMAEERKESDASRSVWLRATKSDNGVVGMLHCLRFEPNGGRLR